VSERIGKKPNEADLSYTAVCTGLSPVFISVPALPDREGSETSEGRPTILLRWPKAQEERGLIVAKIA
jgi:hypothetical protein